MQQLILQDHDLLDRINTLEAIGEILDNHYYERVLSTEEITEESELFATTHLEINRLNAEKKFAMAEWDEKIKAKKRVAEIALAKVKTGRVDVTETVYQVYDEVEGREGLYNRRGELISEKPSKRPGQFRIKGLSTDEYQKTGTNQ